MYAMLAIAMTFTACSDDGEDGEDGMNGTNGIDGVQGLPGADGTDGTNGTDGQDGDDGNANVIASDWIAYDDAQWDDFTTQFGVDQRRYPITVSELTPDVTSSSAILMYTRFSGLPNYYALPFVEAITGIGATGLQELSFQVADQSLTIRMMNTDGIGDPNTFGGVAQYRYVIIPPASNGRGKQVTPEETLAYYIAEGLDISNYEAVRNYFNLKN